jgi:hypothetical protein
MYSDDESSNSGKSTDGPNTDSNLELNKDFVSSTEHEQIIWDIARNKLGEPCEYALFQRSV